MGLALLMIAAVAGLAATEEGGDHNGYHNDGTGRADAVRLVGDSHRMLIHSLSLVAEEGLALADREAHAEPEPLYESRLREAVDAEVGNDSGVSMRSQDGGGLQVSIGVAVNLGPVAGSASGTWRATHYGESYNGQPLGCGGGTYDNTDATIIAVGPELADIPCGTPLRVCLSATGGGSSDRVSEGTAMPRLRCIVGYRRDYCPGCWGDWIDMSEAGLWALCGWQCDVLDRLTVEVLEEVARGD